MPLVGRLHARVFWSRGAVARRISLLDELLQTTSWVTGRLVLSAPIKDHPPVKGPDVKPRRGSV